MSNIVDFDKRRASKAAAVNAEEAAHQPELPLHGGGGGGTSPPMVSLKDYVDKADEAVETRLNAKLETLATKSTVWAAVVTIIGVLLAVLAFGGDRFDAGVGLASQGQAQEERDRSQDATMRRIDGKLDQILAAKSAGNSKADQ